MEGLKRLAGLLALAIAAGCVAPKSEGERPVALGPMERNALVDFGSDPVAPTPPDVGLAIRLGAEGAPATYRRGEPVVLHGAYRANGDLLLKVKSNPTTAIVLVLTRESPREVRTLPLVTPKTPLVSPNETSPPSYSAAYRVGGQFRVDLAAFFELPDDPARYTVEATLDTVKAGPIRFEIMR